MDDYINSNSEESEEEKKDQENVAKFFDEKIDLSAGGNLAVFRQRNSAFSQVKRSGAAALDGTTINENPISISVQE